MANDPARNAAYGAAAKRMREAHPDEWQDYLKEETESRGLEFNPRLSAERKAEKQILDLLEQFPSLRAAIQGPG